MSDFVAIANDAISQIKELKRNRLRFNSPIYLALYNDDHIEKSNLWFILKNADMAVVILPFEYRVITSESSSAYILFIDKNGICNDSISLNGWLLKFDSPKESTYRTYNRYATISKDGHEVTLSTPCEWVGAEEFKRIWEYFKLISTECSDYSSLPLYQNLYDKDVKIEALKADNIRVAYQCLTTSSLLKANEELINTIKQLINSNK